MLRVEVIPGEWVIGTEHGYARARPRIRNRKGKPVSELREFRWFGSLEHALRDVVHSRVRESDARTLADALAVVDETLARLCQAFAGEFEIRPRAGPPKQKGPRTG